MASKVERYLTSKKFKDAMSKVGSDSRPFDNSTPTKEILTMIKEANTKSDGKQCQKQN